MGLRLIFPGVFGGKKRTLYLQQSKYSGMKIYTYINCAKIIYDESKIYFIRCSLSYLLESCNLLKLGEILCRSG